MDFLALPQARLHILIRPIPRATRTLLARNPERHGSGVEHSRFRLKQSLKAGSESWLVRNVVFPVWIRRDHPRYLNYRYEFDRTQFLAKADLEALQIARLRKLLRHAKER
jgi:hypothetical protein